MITTPEQMREAANNDEDLIRRIDAITVAHQYTTSLDDPRMFAEMRAIPIAPQPTPIVDGSGPGPHYVADMLSQFVASVWHLLDNSETSGPIDDPITTVMQSDFDEVSKWLDRLEALPSGSTSHLSAAELVAAYLSPQPVAVTVKPLTAADLSEALSCFWNAAIGASHNMQDGIVLASIMAEGIAAVQIRLQEIADTQIPPAALTVHPADPLSDPRVVALVEAAKRLSAACDAMWNDCERLEKNPHRFGQEYQIKDEHVRAISEAQQCLPAALRAIGGEA